MEQLKAKIESVVTKVDLDQFTWGDVTEFSNLTYKKVMTFEQKNNMGVKEQWEEEGTIWSDAIEAALEKYHTVSIPKMEETVFIDRPIMMKSGYRLKVDPETTIGLAPDTGTCMLRNEHLINGHPTVPVVENTDTDISVAGGIWIQGKVRGEADKEHSIPGSFGTLLFSNVERVQVTDMTICEGSSYGVQISYAKDFYIENIKYDNHHKDGVHINGIAEYGIVRNLSGFTGDDMVALNAWDWCSSATSFGAIRYILVQNLEGHMNELRLLPGRKLHEDGTTSDCPIEHCVFENIKGVYNFKLYCQPNCHNVHTPSLNDYSLINGEIKDVWFKNITFEKILHNGIADIDVDALFELGADCDGVHISDVTVNDNMGELAFLTVGPKSVTWKYAPEFPDTWGELFAPDMICTVKNLTIDRVNLNQDKAMIRVIHLAENPDYPNTTPKGGTGYGILENGAIDGTPFNY